ncbi:MAG: hypothetical protein Q4E39_05645, partial [bacterium]|nr:hypothetical protein [bacterium]
MEEKNNNKKKVNLGKTFKDISGNPQKKAWVILGAYFIFFAIIIFSIRTNNSKNNNQVEYNNNLPFSINKIISNNYDFKYTVDFVDN